MELKWKAIKLTQKLFSENGGLQGSKQVYVAGDDREARDLISTVVRSAGFTPVDMGLLVSARTIEDIPVSVFSQWRIPFLIHLAIFVFLYILSFAKFQVSCKRFLTRSFYNLIINYH